MAADPLHLSRVSTVEALSRGLRERILDGELAPGRRLREVDMAEAYGVGRYTVRSAFQDLVYRGIAEHVPNRGVSVLVPTPETVLDLYTYRAGLECEAARVVIARGRRIQEPERALAKLRDLRSDSPWRKLIEADLGFHQAVVDGAGSSQMSEAFRTITDRVMLCLSQLSAPQTGVVADHEQLLEALRTSRSATAANAFRQHLYDVVEQQRARR